MRTGAESAIIRAEIDRPDSPVLVEAQIQPAGRGRTRVNRKSVSATGICGGLPLHDLLARGSRHRQRRAQGRREPPRRCVGGPRPGGGAGRRRDGAGAPPAGGAVAPVGRAGQRGGHSDPRCLGPAAGRRRQGPRGRPRTSGGRPRAPGGVGLRPSGRRGGPRARGPALRARAGRATSSTRSAARRTDDLRRGVNTVGPHRDDLLLQIEGREARTHASQGEQRCLALALRLGVHDLIRSRTTLVPTLLLDDVFSELDPARSRALVARLPAGQASSPRRRRCPKASRSPGCSRSRASRTGEGRGAAATAAPARSASRCPGCSAASVRRRRRPSSKPCSPAGTSWSAGSWAGAPPPVRVDGRALVVAVEHPAWATRARMESGRILGRLHAFGRARSSVWRWSSAAVSAQPPGTRDRSRVPKWSRCRVEWCVRIERPEVTVRGSIRTAKTYVLKGRACGSEG